MVKVSQIYISQIAADGVSGGWVSEVSSWWALPRLTLENSRPARLSRAVQEVSRKPGTVLGSNPLSLMGTRRTGSRQKEGRRSHYLCGGPIGPLQGREDWRFGRGHHIVDQTEPNRWHRLFGFSLLCFSFSVNLSVHISVTFCNRLN